MNHSMSGDSYRGLTLQEAGIAESLLVVTLRLWILERSLGSKQALPDWRGGLCAIGLDHLAGDVVVPIFEFLYGNRYGVEVVPPHCSRISSEEGNFLACVSLVQQQRMDEVRRLLAGYTFPATARVVLPLLARLGHALEGANMALPVRDAAPVPAREQRSGDTVH